MNEKITLFNSVLDARIATTLALAEEMEIKRDHHDTDSLMFGIYDGFAWECRHAAKEFRSIKTMFNDIFKPVPDVDIMPIEALRIDDARYEMQQERAFEKYLRDDARADFDNE